jgi:hypothetical protein
MTAADRLSELTRRLAGRRVYGGCDECEAYQTIFQVRIHHDDRCPFLARISDHDPHQPDAEGAAIRRATDRKSTVNDSGDHVPSRVVRGITDV